MKGHGDQTIDSACRLALRSELRSYCLCSASRVAADDQPLKLWHTEALTEEFTADMADGQVRTFEDYLALEQRLFRQLDETDLRQDPTGPEHALERFSRGSTQTRTAGNATGTTPSSLERRRLSAASCCSTACRIRHTACGPWARRSTSAATGSSVCACPVTAPRPRVLDPSAGRTWPPPSDWPWRTWRPSWDPSPSTSSAIPPAGPWHWISRSKPSKRGLPVPASLVLISPAIRVHPASALARFKDALSALPGLDGLAYLAVMEEFDPFNYNSFATNAGAQVHAITRDVDRRIEALAQDPQPPASCRRFSHSSPRSTQPSPPKRWSTTC